VSFGSGSPLAADDQQVSIMTQRTMMDIRGMSSPKGIERFTVFTDGVAAIAITLMVLPLVDLASSAGRDGTNLLDLIRDNSNVILTFS
jgi:uncharacterized membrane protein